MRVFLVKLDMFSLENSFPAVLLLASSQRAPTAVEVHDRGTHTDELLRSLVRNSSKIAIVQVSAFGAVLDLASTGRTAPTLPRNPIKARSL